MSIQKQINRVVRRPVSKRAGALNAAKKSIDRAIKPHERLSVSRLIEKPTLLKTIMVKTAFLLRPITKKLDRHGRKVYGEFNRLINYNNRRKLHLSMIFVLIVLPIFLLTLNYFLTRPNYNISVQAQKLLTEPDYALAKGVVYNSKAQSFTVDKAGMGKQSSVAGDQSVTVGGNKSYTSTIYSDLNKGITVNDNSSKLSFNIAPQFKSASGKEIAERFVYPLASNRSAQDIYTPKNDGLEEDLVLNRKVGSSASFTYKLNLPSTLQARLSPNGSIGIYSADPLLFGNISYGNSSDQQSVMNARTKGPKNNLVFVLLTPTIRQSGQALDTVSPGQSNVSYSLKNNLLTMTATDLSSLKYPLTIDPSIVDTAAATTGFTNGNIEGDIGLGSSQISESGLTGGGLADQNSGNWTDTGGAALPSSSGNVFAATDVYDGYIYEIGGLNNGVAEPDIEYATLGSNGSLSAPSCSGTGFSLSGDWCTYSSMSLPSADYGVASTIYNGYMYIEDTGMSSSVYYAAINSSTGALIHPSGCSGSTSACDWTPSSSTGLTAEQGASMQVYDDNIYIIGGNSGCTWSTTNTVQYAQLNGSGSLTSWTGSTLPFSSGESYLAAAVYNGYMYVWGGGNNSSGCGSSNNNDWTSNNNMYYTKVSSTGSLGTWSLVGTLPSAMGDTAMGYGVYDGYLYSIAGVTFNGSSLTTASYPTGVYYTSINSNGTIVTSGGTVNFQLTNSLATKHSSPSYSIAGQGSAIYNGYVYNVGGYYGGGASSCPFNCAGIDDAQYAKIDPAGWLGEPTNLSSTYNLPAQLEYPSVVAGDGWLYVMGGQNTSGAPTNVIYYTAINPNGSLGVTPSGTMSGDCTTGGGTMSGSIWCVSTNTLPQADWGMGAAYWPANHEMYLAGGCTSTGSCTSTSRYLQYFTITPSTGGVVTTGFNSTRIPSSNAFGTLVFENEELLLMGGIHTASTAVNTIYEWGVQTNGNLGTGATSTSSYTLADAVYNASSVFYDDEVYVIGGENSSGVAQAYVQESSVYPLTTSTSSNSGLPTASFTNDTNSLNTAEWGGCCWYI